MLTVYPDISSAGLLKFLHTGALLHVQQLTNAMLNAYGTWSNHPDMTEQEYDATAQALTIASALTQISQDEDWFALSYWLNNDYPPGQVVGGWPHSQRLVRTYGLEPGPLLDNYQPTALCPELYAIDCAALPKESKV